jgi:hypothetical protein
VYAPGPTVDYIFESRLWPIFMLFRGLANKSIVLYVPGPLLGFKLDYGLPTVFEKFVADSLGLT